MPSALKNLPRDLTKMPAVITHYTAREHEIISAEVESILETIRDRIWMAVEVAEAFCKAATVANQLVPRFKDRCKDNAYMQCRRQTA